MPVNQFPPLPLIAWQPTRDTIHFYSKLPGRIRRALTPPQKHWWHASLQVSSTGLTTTAIPVPERSPATFQMVLDLLTHRLAISTSWGEAREMPLNGKPVQEFYHQTIDALSEMGIRSKIRLEVDAALFEDAQPRVYDPQAAGIFWQALQAVDQALKQFKSELPCETSPVQFWPHNFDLALMWLPGTQVAGVDPADVEHADKQMAFGFSTGDVGIPDAYFYITAYPWPEDLMNQPLPAGAAWHTSGWKGALLMYSTVSTADNPKEKLLDFLRAGFRAGSVFLR